MALSDSEEENLEELEFGDEEGDGDVEEEILDVGVEEVEDADDDSVSDDSDDGSDDEEDDEQPFSGAPAEVDKKALPLERSQRVSPQPLPIVDAPPPVKRRRSLSPAEARKRSLLLQLDKLPLNPSFTVEAICALPHPVPTHALAASTCMTHLLTGSDDGYIRDYDIFPAVNGKNFLTAPQRHHSGVVEGIMKAGQLRCWWENPVLPDLAKSAGIPPPEDELTLAPVYSLAMHSDALWSLAGTDSGSINLFTVRHEPGRLAHVMNGHKGPVSALSVDYDEKGFFSAGWDGEAMQWDLNTGQRVRNFVAHGAQLAAIAVRPLKSGYSPVNSPPTFQATESATTSQTFSSDQGTESETQGAVAQTTDDQLETDAKSDASFDPLFDGDLDPVQDNTIKPTDVALPGSENVNPSQSTLSRSVPGALPAPKNAPPLLDSSVYPTYSPDLLMTAFVDGQVVLWDRRVRSAGQGVGRLWMSEKTPPWCLSACWSADGAQIYAGRRNGAVDVWDVRQLGASGPSTTPRLLKTLRNPPSSGVVSCVVAFPDCRHIACASVDNIRLWNVWEAVESDSFGKIKGGVQFKIIPGHHGGYISQMVIDPGMRFMVSASSNRGWHGESTRTVFVHDIKRS